MFVDNVDIIIRAGNGGSGLASFKREKFLPFGGPDGGDGGKGGDIYFLADSNIQDLSGFKHKTVFKAANGGRGGPNKMHGLNADGLTIKVPAGTSIYVKEDARELLLSDLWKEGQKVVAARGGKGGRGNVHFATSTRKAPHIFQPGEQGEELTVALRMTLPVDVCIIGLANSGKSSLLSIVSAAQPKVADYPFTTQEPVLGVVDDGVKKYVWGEIPAFLGGTTGRRIAGGGYLGQAARASVLIYLLDASSNDIEGDFRRLNKEVLDFGAGLGTKKSLIAVNKADLLDRGSEKTTNDQLNFSGLPIYFISALDKSGISELIVAVHGLAAGEAPKTADEMRPEIIFRPKPVDQGA